MMKITLRAAVAAALIGASQAQGGGLWLNQYGDFASGRSSAGAAAGVDEAATIIHNPASATRIEGSQLTGSVGLIVPDVQFDLDYTSPINGSDNGGSAGLDAPVASLAYVHDLGSDRWSIGVYTAGLAGAGLEYNREWAGRFQNTRVELLLLTIAPTVAYRVTDQFSVGAALQYYYSSLDLDLALPSLPGRDEGKGTLDGTDTGFGFTLGAVYEFSDTLRMGINYQSELDIDYDGKLRLRNTQAGLRVNSNTELTMAQMVRVGLHYDIGSDSALALSWGWDDWSALDNVFVSLPELEAPLAKNWDDTYHYAAGFETAVGADWDITAGVAYDTNPVSAHDRTADMPVDRQVRYTAGTRYKLREHLTVGGYINYTDLGSARISGQRWGGEYRDNEVLEFSLYLNWTL